ncbi:DUF4058 family protein [cf. Phormidesmis sp. LEGE 11477]|uniref:DUF4058 family protein n=1 Tax=cf. Phormidesmis sp. LEGE 11477 TaxID=1828680 RepID=UPI00187E75BE|nr:DUF4058 family protein [cf. Phormidesmis sp. LEGE 11477]MBE9063043.1 DUF4058 family protein [cf. Phormidesmis sp. LEGE 11477]
MPSPFPGMDPYLEGYLWPDVHSALASKIRQHLTPLLRPKYAARLEVYLAEDPFPENEIGILYPDVEIVEARSRPETALPDSSRTLTITPPALSLPILQSVQIRVTSVEIRDTANNRLVTSIEVLSPVNKREPGLTTYRQKRKRLYRADVHLLELDLLRRGHRPFAHPRLPKVSYCIALTRTKTKQTEIWPVELSTPLPVVPVPLQSPDLDVPLDLQSVLTEIYQEAAYELTLDYSQAPPPPMLSPAEAEWLKTIL